MASLELLYAHDSIAKVVKLGCGINPKGKVFIKKYRDKKKMLIFLLEQTLR